MKRPITWLIAALVALATIGVVFAATPTPTPEPAPVIHFTKTATVVGDFVSYTITVTNSGNSQTTDLTVVDTLPAGIDWFVMTDTMDCGIGPSATPGRELLSCGPFVTEPRHLNDAEDDFVNGSNSVTVGGIVSRCGDFVNTALLFPSGTIASATANVPCPATPTPTATPITPTATPTQPPPTATPTMATPTEPPVSTTRPSSSTLKPPNTGSGSSINSSGPTLAFEISVFGSAAVVFLIGLFAIWRRHHESI